MTDRSNELVRTLQEAADHMDRCAGSASEEAKRCFHEAFTRVIRARNHLMQAVASERHGGAAPSAGETARGELQLRQVNALLSLMASFDFPLAGFHPERLDGARREIRSLLEELTEGDLERAADSDESRL